MSEKIEKTLKKIAETIPDETTPTSSNTDPRPLSGLPGDPDCPYCQGIGYLRQDLPVGHPDFGRLQLCSCRQTHMRQVAMQRLFVMSNLNELQHMTFETFEPRGRIGLAPVQADSLERAYNHAKHFAGNLAGWLVLQGSYGCGKTHLAAAIANFVVSLGIPTLFITVPDMLDTLRFAYSDPESTFEERFDEIRQVRLLILDDFGTHNATPWAQEKLFQIINYRYVNRLPTVVTTNLELEEIESRIRSRLRDPELVTRALILATDFRDPTDETGHAEISSLPQMRERTFGTFSDRQNEKLTSDASRSLLTAFAAAREYAENPRGWLVFLGGYGTGKTHLAAAIGNYRTSNGYQTLFVYVPDLLDHLRATFNPNSTVRFDKRFEEVRTAPLLILDSLESQSMSAWVKEKLYQIINFRYNAQLPTIITSAEDINAMDARLRSRLIDSRLCSIYKLDVPEFVGIPRAPARRSSKRVK
jgi:DNA replication protein DnaC